MSDSGTGAIRGRATKAGASRRLACHIGALSLLGIMMAPAAWSDGGAVICAGRTGDLQITLFATPAPVTIGAADLSVLVQRADGSAVLNAKVTLEMLPPRDGRAMEVYPTRAAAVNRLLYAAPADFPIAGPWTIRARIEADGQQTAITCGVPIEPVAGQLRSIMWYLAPVPAVLIIFALHQLLAYSGRSRAGGEKL